MAEVTQQKDKKSTRKVIIILLIIITIIIILLLLMRCGGSKKELKPVEEQKEEQTVEVVEKKSTGFVDVVDKTVTPELKELFDKATSKDTNIKYEPIELIAKQENEDSIDYKFLAQEATGTDDPDNRQKFIIIVREDFGGDVSLTEVEAVVEPDEDAHNKKTIVVDDGKATTTYYLVVFRDQYGNELQRTALPYGATPSYNGWLPEGFQHWDKEISPVTGNVNYYAVCYEVHHSEPSDEPVTPVTPVDAGFYTNSLYSQTYTGGNIIDTVFTTYEDTNPSSEFNGYKIALLSMGAPAPVEQDAPVFRGAGFTRYYYRCAYKVDTTTTPKTITIYTDPTKKPEEHPADKKFTIEIGDTMTLKNFPAPGSDIDFNQPDSQLINFFNVDQDKGYAYIGDSMIWLLAKNDNIVINGTPSIQKIGNAPRSGEFFSRYNNTTKYLEIGQSITEIGKNAFYSNLLEGVDFSRATALTTIKQAAFSSCTSLTEITFPNSLRVIESKAFDSCTALNDLDLNEGLITIGQEAFTNCTDLSTVTIPSTVETIGRGAFSNDINLSTLTFAGTTPSIKTIESFAFCDKGGSVTLTIPSSVEKLGLKCFNEFDPVNITLAADLRNTKWLLYSSTGDQIGNMFILGNDEQSKDFIRGLTGDSGFSQKDNFTDDNLGYFEIIHQTQPVR